MVLFCYLTLYFVIETVSRPQEISGILSKNDDDGNENVT